MNQENKEDRYREPKVEFRIPRHDTGVIAGAFGHKFGQLT